MKQQPHAAYILGIFILFCAVMGPAAASAAGPRNVDGCWEATVNGRPTYTINTTQARERFATMHQPDGTVLTRAWVRFDAVTQEGDTVHFVTMGEKIIAMRPISPNVLEQASLKGRDPSPQQWTRSSPETERRIRALMPDFAHLNGQWRIKDSTKPFLAFDAAQRQVTMQDPELVKRFGTKPLVIHSLILLSGDWGTTIHLTAPDTKERLWLHKSDNSAVMGVGVGMPVKPEAYIAQGTKGE